MDTLAEWWASLGGRARIAVVAVLVVLLLAVTEWRVAAVEGRWGGPPARALVATEDLAVGAPPSGLRAVVVPPAVLPSDALADVPPDAVLAFALPAGAVLTRRHIDARGPGAGLAAHLRAVPLPVDDGWGITAGSWVDVWVTAPPAGGVPVSQEASAVLVARSRPVLDVTDGATALVGLGIDEVGPVTAALAMGRVLLAHAPAP